MVTLVVAKSCLGQSACSKERRTVREGRGTNLLLYGATLPDVTRRQGEGETRGTNGTRDEGCFIVGMGNKITKSKFSF